MKSGVDKTCAMVGGMWYGEVEKESHEDMFLVLFAEKNLLEWDGNMTPTCKDLSPNLTL